MRSDFQHAFRQLSQAPGFAAIVVFVLALGIGVNVATFGAVDALFFRPTPGVVDPQQVRRLEIEMPPVPGQQVFFNLGYSLADIAALRARTETFGTLGAYVSGTAKITGGAGAAGVTAEGEPRAVNVTLADGGYFAALGVGPALGRTFAPGEDSLFAEAPVAILSHRFWTSAFAADPGVLGRTIRLNGRPITIIGVAPPRFTGTELEPVDLFMPLGMVEMIGYQRDFVQRPSMKWLSAIARVAPGSDDRRLEAVATGVLRRVDAATDSAPVLGFDAARGRLVRPAALNAYFGPKPFGRSSPVPLWMLGATAAVLLVVCANVANLLVARAERRRREIATRVALGAGGRRIVRQLLAEGLLLAAVGGALGVAIASAGSRLFRLIPGMPPLDDLVGGRAMLFALGATLLTTIGFALVPALHAARSDAGELLRSGVRGTARATPVRAALLAIQFAVSLALLGVGALFVRSVRNVQAVDVGFDIAHSLTVSADWRAFGVTPVEARTLLDGVAEAVRTMPAVAGASLVSLAPFDGVMMSSLRVPGRGDLSAISGVPGGMVFTNAVDTAYFRTLAIDLVDGRAFDDRDRQGGGAVIVNETFARRIWPNERVIGKCVYTRTDAGAPCATVVGVAKDVRFSSLKSSIAPMFYTPLAETGSSAPRLIVRLRPDASPAARARTMASIRRSMTALDGRVTFASVRPLGSAALSSALAPYRVSATAFTVFGGLALLLASIGLYGVVAYAVAQRTGEFGVRVALGARASDVAALVFRQGFRLIGVGTAVGVASAVAVGWLLRSRLFGVEPTDVPALASVALLLGTVALAACWIPARRAARIAPTEALRSE